MDRLLKVDSIMFFVKDLGASALFYQEVLGMKRAWTDEERGMIGLTFQESDAEIVIHNDSTLPSVDYSFSVEDVESFCKGLRQKGYEVLSGPFEVRCGKFAVLSDLDGNRIPIIDLTLFGGKPRYDE